MSNVFIEEYTVTQPPTSAEVRRAIACAINSDGFMELTLLPHREVPKAEELLTKVALSQVIRLETGETRARGTTEEDLFITIHSPNKNSEPAYASIVMKR